MRLQGLYLLTPDYYGEGFFQKLQLALDAGIDLLQYRDKINPYSVKLDVSRRIRRITVDYDVPLIIDDDPALAGECYADGVHVGRDDPSIAEVRDILGDVIIGYSTYGDIQRALQGQKDGASYVAFGSFFPTTSKEGAELCDLRVLEEAKKILNIPIFAIGGINEDNVGRIMQYGISGVAVISSIFSSADPFSACRRLRSEIEKFIVPGFKC